MNSNFIDFHIEVSSSRLFLNSLIESEKVEFFEIVDVFESLKSAVVNSGLRPFIVFPPINDEEKAYYNKYINLLSKVDLEKEIPDFFQFENDFYDLEESVYVRRDLVNDEDFHRLFCYKLWEINIYGQSVDKFLDFQLYDNFFGNTQHLVNYLNRVLFAGNTLSLPEPLNEAIQSWIKSQALESGIGENGHPVSREKLLLNDLGPIGQESNDFISSRRGKRIETKWTEDQIKGYFSFFYLEKSVNQEPYLTQEQVDTIFQHGLVIPEAPIQQRYKLNIDAKYPKRAISYAIHRFFVESSLDHTDKRDYILFFGAYILDYADAYESNEKLKQTASNISGKSSGRIKFNLNKYLP